MPLPNGLEWVLIIGIALLLLGPSKLPEVAASLGKSIREFRKATTEVQDAVKLDASPLPAGPATPQTPAPPMAMAQGQPPQTHPTPQTSEEPEVEQPIAPIAPQTGSVGPVVTAPDDPEPVADSAPTDVAPKAED
ncbi:MAG TPA: twin-arginine translocase TatA/TatE family subunit [Candidatus Limnocylindrales bacterium]|nr:twin-arginine translocase TatA/TatE family subunit [Candidatus Limnocylindrales bacterium]